MFLATTALSEFWDKDESLLYLGSWCLPGRGREAVRAQVLPSPWNDRERFYQSAEYLTQCYERMLRELAVYLNSVHQLNEPVRYWRILLGPWLCHFLHAVYDRYIHLSEALDQDKDLKTIQMDPASFRTPKTLRETMNWLVDDPYNLQIISELLTRMGYDFPKKKLSTPWTQTQKDEQKENLRQSLRNWSRPWMDWAERTSGRLLSQKHPAVLFDLYWPRQETWKLSSRLGFKAVPLQLNPALAGTSIPAKLDQHRLGLACLNAQDPFELIFVSLLANHLPTVHLEGLAALDKAVSLECPQKFSMVVSANGWYHHEPFKLLAAKTAAQGGRLVGAQHGGGYGVYRTSPQEEHEREICDTFLTWGWGNRSKAGVRNIPVPQFSRTNTSQGQGITFVSTTNPRYFYRFFSTPQGSQLDEYWDWQVRFMQEIPESLQEQMRFRRHPREYGHQAQTQLIRNFPKLSWEEAASFTQVLEKSQLMVIDHIATPILESLAANRPTLLFWDENRWEIREEAQPYFNQLKQAGVLHASPEAAAQALQEIWKDPEVWWQDASRQKAREQFVSQHALKTPAWSEAWAGVLQQELAATQKVAS